MHLYETKEIMEGGTPFYQAWKIAMKECKVPQQQLEVDS
jgi:hypothetical protein